MDKTLSALLVLFFLSFTIFVSLVFFNKPLARFTRAKEDFLPSASNSLMFAHPLTVAADGAAESTVNVFIRSEKGMPVKEQKVTLNVSSGSVKEPEVTTDDQGKATFHITSDTAAVADIEAYVGGSLKLTQKLSVKFQ
jgi:hypothetical protein